MSMQVNKCSSQGVYMPSGDIKDKVLSILDRRKVDPDSLIEVLKGASSKKDLQKRQKDIQDPSLKKAVKDVSEMDLNVISIGEIIAMISKVSKEMKDSLVKFAKTWNDSMDNTFSMGIGAASADKTARKMEAIGGILGGIVMVIGGSIGMAASFNEGMLKGELSGKLGEIINSNTPEVEENAIQGAQVEDIDQDEISGASSFEEEFSDGSDGSVFGNEREDIVSIAEEEEDFPDMQEEEEVQRGRFSLEREEDQEERDQMVKTEVNKSRKSYKYAEDRAIRKSELENEYAEKTSKFGADFGQKMQGMSQALGGVTEQSAKNFAASYNAQSGILNSFRDLLSSEKVRRQGLFDSTNKLQDTTAGLGQVIGRYISACATAV